MESLVDAAREYSNDVSDDAVTREFLSKYPLPELCTALVSPELEEPQREQVAAAVRKLLRNNEQMVNDADSVALVIAGIAQPYVSARLLAASQLSHLSDAVLEASPSVLMAAVRTLDDQSVTVASCAEQAIIDFSKRGERIASLLFEGAVGEELRRLLDGRGSQRDTTTVRALHAIVSSAEHSTRARAEANAAVGAMSASLAKNDLLLTMNVIELLTQVAELPNGVETLKSVGALDTMKNMLGAAVDRPEESDRVILASAICRLLAAAGAAEHCTDAGALAEFIFVLGRILLANDFRLLSMQDDAVSALGGIGSSGEGLSMLLQAENRTVLDSLLRLADSPKSELKIAALYSIAALLRRRPHGTGASEEVTHSVFDHLDQQNASVRAGERLTTLVKQPFPEVNVAALQVFERLVEWQWGVKVCATTPGWVDAMCDLNSDSLEVTYAKLDVIRKVVQMGQEAFGDSSFQRLSAVLQRSDEGKPPAVDPAVDIATMQR